MLVPSVNPRIKQACQLSSFEINRRDAAPFESIADGATESKILRCCLATMFKRDDVIYLVLGQRELF